MWASEAGSGVGGVSGTSQIPPQHPLTHLFNCYSGGMTQDTRQQGEAAGGVLEKQRPDLQFQLGHSLAVP